MSKAPDCPMCHSRGYSYREPCDECDGAGGDACYYDDCPGYHEHECGDCLGTGRQLTANERRRELVERNAGLTIREVTQADIESHRQRVERVREHRERAEQ